MTERPMDEILEPVEPMIEELPSEEVPMATAQASVAEPAQPVAPPLRRPHPIRGLRRLLGGLSAVGVKELRGRMRGRRAFVVLTLYLVLLGLFAWMYELILEQRYSVSSGGTAAYAGRASSLRP